MNDLPSPGASGLSWASSPARRRIMLGNRRRDTAPELRVRRLLHTLGMRFRVDYAPERGLRCRADIVFTKAKVAVFIDGCFWHGCPEHYRPPATNPEYWHPKIELNRARDARNNQALAEAGWTVVRYWEHEDPAVLSMDIRRTYLDNLRRTGKR
ncbi:very short patch repair endonuclease [Agromyces albus]|uniref:very short patch repair endonuclease n=1 Tax=Agromyces albus TaxID=205332 RepID=UPI0027D777DB|nr:very short patch repair endonuclease [Agromyces albus]